MAGRAPFPPPPPPPPPPPGVGQRGIKSSRMRKTGTRLPQLPTIDEEISKAKVFRFLKPDTPLSPLPAPPPWMTTPPEEGCAMFTPPTPLSPAPPLSRMTPPPPLSRMTPPPPLSRMTPPPPLPRMTPPPPLSPISSAQFPSPLESLPPPTPPRPSRPASPRSTPPELPPHVKMEASPQREGRRDDPTARPPTKDPYVGSKNVMTLTGDNFQTFVNSKALAMVLFYHPLDDKSAAFKGHFKKAADAKKLDHQFAAVDCQQDHTFCDSQTVTTFPVFRLYSYGTVLGTIRDTSKFDHKAITKYIDTLTSMGEPQKHLKTGFVPEPPGPQESKCSLAKRLGFKK